MATAKTRSQEIAQDVVALLRARNPLLWVVSREEARVEGYLKEAAAGAGFITRCWDVGQGVTDAAGKPQDRIGSEDPGQTLDTISARAQGSQEERCVWIMRDLPPWLAGSIGMTTCRKLRNLARLLPGVPRANAQSIVVLSPSGEVPPELAGHATVIDWPLPDRAEIASILDAAIRALPEEMQAAAAPNGQREQAIDSAVGLSGEEAAACYAKSLVQLRRVDPATVAKEKKRVIARERVLEWFDPIPAGLDAVGGLEELKGWLASRKLAYSPKAREYGLPSPKGALLVGIPGCLTGDTIINVNRKQRPGGYKGITLEALFYRFNNRHAEGSKRGLYEKSKQWDLSFPTRSHCYLEDQGYIGFNEIERVVYSGVKEVYRLTTDHGTEIKATADHQFLTTRGYVALGDLPEGEAIYAQDGVLLDSHSTGRNLQKPIRQINNVGNHPFARRRIVNGLEYTSHPLHRLVIEADMNGLRLEEFLWALHGDTTALKFLPEDMEGHHKDGDRDNNTLSNVEPMTKAGHARLHLSDNNPNRYRYAPRTQRVLSIRRVGMMPTYDIQMRAPNHNFLANGLVVHNCGKSLTAKAIATAWNVPLLKVDLGALKSKFVGESEANLRKAFGVIQAIGRCVVWLDEIEKSLAGATQGGADGGVSSDALGAILSWMQDRQGEAFVMATANDISALPPELLRKGRFDEVWFVDLPNYVERHEILKAALRAHGRGAFSEQGDATAEAGWDAVCEATDRFTGAEIASLVPDAMFHAFADEAREITTDDLLAAAKTVVPLSRTMADKILALRTWADGRARYATPREERKALREGRQLDL